MDPPPAEVLLSWSHLDQPDVWSAETRVSRETALDTIRADARPRLWRMSAADPNPNVDRVPPALLVHADGAAMRLPSPRWGDPDGGRMSQACPWSERRDWIEAWQECKDIGWFIQNTAALCGEVPSMLAACAMMRSFLHYSTGHHGMTLRMIEAIESWCHGTATRDDVSIARRVIDVRIESDDRPEMELMIGVAFLWRENGPDLTCLADDIRYTLRADRALSEDDRRQRIVRCLDIAREYMTARSMIEGLLVARRADLVRE